MSTTRVTDHDAASTDSEIRSAAATALSDRVTIGLLGLTVALLIAGRVLAWLDTLRVGPTLILAAAGGYSLYVLATQHWTQPRRLPVGTGVGRILALLLVAVPVYLGWFASGYPIVDGVEAAHRFTAVEAAVTGTLDHPNEFTTDPAVDDALPGIRRGVASWSVDDQRLWTVGLTAAAWLGGDAANHLGAGLAALLVLIVYGIGSRLVTSGFALLAAMVVAVSLPVFSGARFLSPSILAGVLALGGLFLLIEAIPSGSLLGAVPAGAALGLAPAVDPVMAGMVGALAVYGAAVLPRTGTVGFVVHDRVRAALVGVSVGAAIPLVISLVELARAGNLGRAGLGVIVPLALAASIAAVQRLTRPAQLASVTGRRIVSTLVVVAVAVVVAGAVAFDTPLIDVVRRQLGLPLIVLGLTGFGLMAYEIAGEPTDIASPERLLVMVGGPASAVVLLLRPEEGLAATASLIPVVALLAIASTVAAGRWFADPDRYILQTVAVVAAVSLFIVPVVRATETWDLEPQPGAAASMAGICELLEVDAAVLVTGGGPSPEDQAVAGLLTGGVRGTCRAPAAVLPAGRTISSVQRFERLAYESNHTPYLIAQVVLPFGLQGPDLVAADAVDVAIGSIVWDASGIPQAGRELRETVRVALFE